MAIEKEIGECLRARHLTMGTAESCTGGYIAHLITRVAGSSDYFCGGVVSYSNEVKHHVLGVSEESLVQYGAVSRPVVEQMALERSACYVATVLLPLPALLAPVEVQPENLSEPSGLLPP